jgi:hypothetical protein
VEENVAVTQDGVDVLTAYPREVRSLWPGTDTLVGAGDSPDQEASSLSGVPLAVSLASDALRRQRVRGGKLKAAKIQRGKVPQ